MAEPLVSEQDYGADGFAALSRPHTVEVVLADGGGSRFRDNGVEVRRYETTQLDSLRASRRITYEQWCAARHATALWRGASLQSGVTSRYEVWVSGASGRWLSTDESEDEAAPWRALLGALSAEPARALEALVMSTLRERSFPYLLEALDVIAKDIGV